MSSNFDLLAAAAQALHPLLPELVFVGGCVTGLLITDTAAGDLRPTYDVDAIAEITSYAEYAGFSERMRGLGFTEDLREGAPVCRWRHGTITFNILPLDTAVLGFANRWYRDAMHHAQEYILISELTVRVISATYFLATKLEAFKSRGGNDYYASHDLEDVIAVIAGRPELVNELKASSSDVRLLVRSEIAHLLTIRAFVDALPGYLFPDLESQKQLGKLVLRLQAIANL